MGNEIVESIFQVMELGLSNSIIQNHTEDASLSGSAVTIGGNKMVNFGSCAYLGIEHHPSLKQGVVEATDKFGVQFSSSRAYVSVGLVQELESELQKIFDQPLIVTPSTTLGHLAAMPVVVKDEDAVILDMQVHTSVQMAAQQLKARGVNISIVRHNDMRALEKKLKELRPKHKTIWYMADGVYSMYGDYAPLDDIVALMERYPELHLYIDDAHGMGWCGKRGSGYVRSQIAHHPKMVMATSLNKSFSAAGGCIIFPNEEMRKKVLLCGAPLIFSGPIQPPMLGAAIASARLHQTDEIDRRQARLAQLTRHMNRRLSENGIPQVMENDTPIFFIPVGLPRLINPFVRKLKDDGFLINPAAFPAVPMKRGGLRFMTNHHLTEAEIDRLVSCILVHYHEMLADEGITEEDIARNFRIAPFKLKALNKSVVTPIKKQVALHSRCTDTITAVDPVEWDALHAAVGTVSHRTLQALESVFADTSEHGWGFNYFQVHDAQKRPVLSTFYTTVRIKDDMFAPAAVSAHIEEMRRREPDYLTSMVVMLGSMITKGEHLYLDRSHPQWKDALQTLIDHMQQRVAEVDGTQLILRDFYGDLDSELKQTMLDKGFITQQMPNTMQIDALGWENRDAYLSRLGGRYRSDLRREILKYEDKFRVVIDKPIDEEEIQTCYRLYLNVFERSLEMNVHPLPFEYFRTACTHDSYDVIRLYLVDDPRDEQERQPVGVLFSHYESDIYHALIVGIDYELGYDTGTYKQILFQAAERANQLGASQFDLAFTAELVKKKIGARPKSTWAFVQLMDTYNLQVIDAIGQGVANRVG